MVECATHTSTRSTVMNFELTDLKYKEESVIMSQSVVHEVPETKHREISNLKDHNVFEKVDNEGQEFIESKWILTKKSLMEKEW